MGKSAGATTINAITSGTAETIFDSALDEKANRLFIYNPSAEIVYVQVEGLHKVGEFFPMRPQVGLTFGPVLPPGIKTVKAYAAAPGTVVEHTVLSRF